MPIDCFPTKQVSLQVAGSLALLDLVAPGSRFTGQFSEQFHSREIEANAMIETCSPTNEREMVHFEFQSKADPNIAQHMLEYATLAYRRYERHSAMPEHCAVF